MKDVRSIVRGFLNDETVREKKPFEPLPEEPKKKVTRVDNPSSQEKLFGSKRVIYTPPPREEVREQEEVVQPTRLCQHTDDGKHQWEWKGGVKKCWLCGTLAPVDRRDSSTGWNGRTSKRKA